MGLATFENYLTCLGSFVEKSVGKSHEYSPNDTGYMLQCPHKLWTLDGYRYATIFKTVAYIVTDEDEFGNPVFEKWHIKQHKLF
jgi:hypothetical protein